MKVIIYVKNPNGVVSHSKSMEDGQEAIEYVRELCKKYPASWVHVDVDERAN